MTANPTLLPKEVAALVQHIELNRSGWWLKVVQRLALAAVWWADHPPSAGEIKQTLLREFSLSLSDEKLARTLGELEKQDLLIVIDEGKYRLPDEQRRRLEQDIAAAEEVELNASAYFRDLASKHCPSLDSLTLWNAFYEKLLAPLIKETGANAYHLIAGNSFIIDRSLVTNFSNEFASQFHLPLKGLIAEFLDPKKEDVRAYISRMLHARYCVEAGGLPEATIDALNNTVSRNVAFRVFVDTNFLFSLIELHENPSNAAARELLDVISHLKSNPKVTLFIVPRTIEEARTSIAGVMQHFSGIPATENFRLALEKVELSGLGQKYLSEAARQGGRLSAKEWFDPYYKNIVAIAKGKGVEFFNENLDSYSQRQDVIDDILSVLESEKRREGNRRKSYVKVAHDMILWHFVKDKRPAYIESPINARDWILTVDFRLIGFDRAQQRRSSSDVPICLHPIALIQLLQFWVPRTKEFEEAMLGSLRLPFLFQEFDTDSERMSLRILRGMSRFEGRDDIPTDTITDVLLNEGLRARLDSQNSESEEADIALIRDALITEMKSRDKVRTEEAQRLSAELSRAKLDLQMLAASEVEKDRVSANQSSQIEDLQDDLRRIQRDSAMRDYFWMFLLVILASGIAAWRADNVLSDLGRLIGIVQMKVFAAVLVFVTLHMVLEWFVRKNTQITVLWPFVQIKKFRGWIWGTVLTTIFVGVFINLYANHIQKQLDHATRDLPKSTLQSPLDPVGGSGSQSVAK